MNFRLTFFLIIFSAFAGFAPTESSIKVPQLGKSTVKEVIAAMTLEEKSSLAVEAGLNVTEAIKKNK
jgi:hypothetical protein